MFSALLHAKQRTAENLCGPENVIRPTCLTSSSPLRANPNQGISLPQTQ